MTTQYLAAQPTGQLRDLVALSGHWLADTGHLALNEYPDGLPVQLAAFDPQRRVCVAVVVCPFELMVRTLADLIGNAAVARGLYGSRHLWPWRVQLHAWRRRDPYTSAWVVRVVELDAKDFVPATGEAGTR